MPVSKLFKSRDVSCEAPWETRSLTPGAWWPGMLVSWFSELVLPITWFSQLVCTALSLTGRFLFSAPGDSSASSSWGAVVFAPLPQTANPPGCGEPALRFSAAGMARACPEAGSAEAYSSCLVRLRLWARGGEVWDALSVTWPGTRGTEIHLFSSARTLGTFSWPRCSHSCWKSLLCWATKTSRRFRLDFISVNSACL